MITMRITSDDMINEALPFTRFQMQSFKGATYFGFESIIIILLLSYCFVLLLSCCFIIDVPKCFKNVYIIWESCPDTIIIIANFHPSCLRSWTWVYNVVCFQVLFA